MKEYYARRAAEYEEIYLKPERQKDLLRLIALLSKAFSGRDVLEIACGTGYWTQFLAKAARSILATDLNPEVLKFAREKNYGACRVSFALADAYEPAPLKRRSNGAFHGFWWSHLPRPKIPDFLAAFHRRLLPGSKVVLIDNLFVEGSSTPISRGDEDGNTYQIRRLKDGSAHEVLKNFPSEALLREDLRGWGRRLSFRPFRYYWLAEYEAIGPQGPADHEETGKAKRREDPA
jgi:demethylmenaquinone methyltransferase/2-methoxy-6-polyprenyl-1,4-benzoquinol methylase